VYPQLKWFMVWRSASNLSSVTVMTVGVLEFLDGDASVSGEVRWHAVVLVDFIVLVVVTRSCAYYVGGPH